MKFLAGELSSNAKAIVRAQLLCMTGIASENVAETHNYSEMGLRSTELSPVRIA
jgi:hypothetical protein